MVVKSFNVYGLRSRRTRRDAAVALAGSLCWVGCSSARFLSESQGSDDGATQIGTPDTVGSSEGTSLTASFLVPPTSSPVVDTTTWTNVLETTVDSGGAISDAPDASVIDTSTQTFASTVSRDAPTVAGTTDTESSPAFDASVEMSTDTMDAGIDAALADSDDGSTRSDASPAQTSAPHDPNICNSGDFGAPQLVLGLGYDDRMWGPAISSDGNVLLFGYTGNDEDLYMATMVPGENRTFENVTGLGTLNTNGSEGTPFLSFDGLTLYFYATRAGGPGDRDLWFATREELRAEFGEPEQVLGVNGTSYDHLPWISDDELRIYYTTERAGGLGHSDIWFATRASKDDPFDNHALVPGINSEFREDAVAFAPDRLTVYFTTDRATDGNLDIWRATRSSRASDFEAAEVVPGVNSDSEDTNLALTRDGKRLYFSSGRDGKQRLWVVARTCP